MAQSSKELTRDTARVVDTLLLDGMRNKLRQAVLASGARSMGREEGVADTPGSGRWRRRSPRRNAGTRDVGLLVVVWTIVRIVVVVLLAISALGFAVRSFREGTGIVISLTGLTVPPVSSLCLRLTPSRSGPYRVLTIDARVSGRGQPRRHTDTRRMEWRRRPPRSGRCPRGAPPAHQVVGRSRSALRLLMYALERRERERRSQAS